MEQNKVLALPRGAPHLSDTNDLAPSHPHEPSDASRRMPTTIVPPVCPSCAQPARLVSGNFLFPHLPKFSRAWFWLCGPCVAWTSCYAGTRRPVGTVADARVREARRAAHEVFDPIWQGWAANEGASREAARRTAYVWLQKELGMTADDCHFAKLGIAECLRVVQLCKMHSAAMADAQIRGIQIGPIADHNRGGVAEC